MRDKPRFDYYRLLHLSSSANDADIKAQYRILSKTHHPDMGGSQAAMAQLNEAYRVLSDPLRRAVYDAERRRALKVPVRTPAQPIRTPPRRQPTPQAQSFAEQLNQPAPKQRRWWWRFGIGLAALALAIGLLSRLPIAEAQSPTEPVTQTATPLQVSYTGDDTNPVLKSSVAPSSSQAPANSSAKAPNATCSNNTLGYESSTCYSSGDNCEDTGTCQKETQPGKSCVTKTFGSFEHTICRQLSGSSTCSSHTVGSHRYTDCD